MGKNHREKEYTHIHTQTHANEEIIKKRNYIFYDNYYFNLFVCSSSLNITIEWNGAKWNEMMWR